MNYKLRGGTYDGWDMVPSDNKYWNDAGDGYSCGVVDRNHTRAANGINLPVYADSIQALFKKTVLIYLPKKPDFQEIYIFDCVRNYSYYRSRKKLRINTKLAATPADTLISNKWQITRNGWQIADYSYLHVYRKKSKYIYEYTGTIHRLVAQPEVF
jgi:hypothetical protein